MKKRQLTIFGMAAVLSLGVITATVATYVHLGTQQTISISGSSAADGEYSLTKVEYSQTENTVFNETDVFASVTYKLGMNASETYNQITTVGKLTAEFTFSGGTNVGSLLTVEAVLAGYGNGMQSGMTYTMTFDENNKWTGSQDLPFSNDGTQTITFNVKKKDGVSLTAKEYTEKLADVQFNYNLTLGEQSDTYEFYYLVGTFNNWSASESYRMAVNVASDSQKHEWMYLGKNGEAVVHQGEEFKLVKGPTADTATTWENVYKVDETYMEISGSNIKAKEDLSAVYFSADGGYLANPVNNA